MESNKLEREIQKYISENVKHGMAHTKLRNDTLRHLQVRLATEHPRWTKEDLKLVDKHVIASLGKNTNMLQEEIAS